jgi:hypothetical protein
LSPPIWPQSHTRSSSFSSPNLFCQKSSSNNSVSDSHNLEDEGKTLYEDFVQKHLIVSPDKNGEVTAGGSVIVIIRQEEQGSNCNIVFACNSTASKSTRTTGGLALQLAATYLCYIQLIFIFMCASPLLLLMHPSA